MAAVHFVRVFGCFLVVAAAAAADSGFSVLYTAEANHLHALAAKVTSLRLLCPGGGSF